MKTSVREIAEVCHEVNRAYCLTLGDTSQPMWESAPQWQIDSVEAGVRAHLANPELTPEQSHEVWLQIKQKDGWKHGPVKDLTKKEHPCMVAYHFLPKEQRVKDHLFKAMVNTCHRLAVVAGVAISDA